MVEEIVEEVADNGCVCFELLLCAIIEDSRYTRGAMVSMMFSNITRLWICIA